jgi:hypothetical protein
MKPNVLQEVKVERLLETLLPHLRLLLRDAPDFGEISISATLHEGNIGRVRLGAEVSRVIVPQADRGGEL